MPRKLYILAGLIMASLSACSDYKPVSTQPINQISPNGIVVPANFSQWQTLSVSHRTDNESLRVILGNVIAIEAARTRPVKTWPDGSILAKFVWKDTEHDVWPDATVPGAFVHVEFMVKDQKKYQRTGGWGFARFLGSSLEPYGEDADFVQECYACHLPVAEQDYVFTKPPVFPGR